MSIRLLFHRACSTSARVLTRFFLFKVNLFIHSAEVGTLIKEANSCSHWFLSLHSVASSLEKPLLAGYFKSWAVIKRWGQEISPGYYEHGPRLLSKENRRKIEPKETPSRLVPCLLVVFTLQFEILATTLKRRI